MKKTLLLLGLIILSVASFSQTETPDCLAPLDLHKTNISTESITVEWTEQGTAATWELLYGEAGFYDNEPGTQVSTTSESYEITGLTSGTTYDVYVRPVCSDERSLEWTGPLSVHVPVYGDNCETAIDLSGLTSPYQGSIERAISDFDFCDLSGKRDLIFYYDVAPDAALEVWEPNYYFKGIGAMRWGDTCPGDNEIVCGIDTDGGRFFWVNETESYQRVWFVLAGMYNWVSDFALNWQYYEPGFCLMSKSLSLDDVTTSSASLSWSNQYGTGPWEVAYGLSGFDLSTEGERQIVASPEVILSDLQHSQRYEVYVRALCTTDLESAWTTMSLTTECGVWELPFQYDFTTSNCWDYFRVGSSAYYQLSKQQLKVYATDATIVVISPEIGGDFNDLLLSFNGSLINDAAGSGSLDVGVLSDPDDMTTFISQAVYSASDLSKDLMPFRVILSEVPETHRYIGFKLAAEESVTQVEFTLDDVVLDIAPACISPQSLRRTSFTNESLVAGWQEVGTAQQWELIYGKSGFDVDGEGVSVVVNSPTYEVSGLAAGESYEFYVRSVCEEAQYSDWSGPVIMKLPVMGDNCSNAIDLSELTAPYFGSTIKANNDYSICGMGNGNDLVFYYDVEPGEGLMFLHLYDNYYSRVSLRWGGACPGENEIVCGADIQDKPLEWVNETGEIQRVWLVEGSSYDSGKFALYWKSLAPGYCLTPNDLVELHTDGSVKLSWSNSAGVEEWEVRYGLQGFDMEVDGSQLIVTEPSVVLNGLQHSTSYDYYVRAICSVDDKSSWASSSFSTECGNISLPFNVDFENQQDLSCWKLLNLEGWANSYISNGSVYYSMDPGNILLHVLPEISEIAQNTLVRVRPSTAYFGSGVMEIGTLSAFNDYTTFVAAASFQISSVDEKVHEFGAILDEWPEGHSYIGIRVVNTGTDHFQLGFDALEVELLNDCMVPTNFRVDELASRSAILSWQELGLADEWELKISPRNSDDETDERFYKTGSTTFEVEGLNPNLAYEVYVRSTCLEEGAWAGPLSFYTPLACATPTGVTTERLSGSSALISWDGVDGINEWELRYRNLGSEEAQIVTVTGDAQHLLEQLDPEVYYEVDVRAVCAGDGMSWSSSGVTIPILCAGPITLPFSESFAGLPNNSFPVCWESFWSPKATGELMVANTRDLGEYLYFNLTSSESAITAILPEMTQSISNVRVSFKTYKPSWNGNQAKLQVGVLGENGFVEVETIVLESSTRLAWKDHRVYFNNSGLTEGRLAFRLITGEYESYRTFYLSDIKVEMIPDVTDPHALSMNDLNQTSGELSWSQFETADKVDLVWGNVGFNPDSEGQNVVLPAEALKCQVSDLSPNTSYEAYVRNVSNQGGASQWAGPLEFHTPCAPMQINLLNVEENEVLYAGEDNVVRLAYNYLCYGRDFTLFLLGLDDDKTYEISQLRPTSETGEFEFVLPETLWGGNYAVALSYPTYDSQGLSTELLAQSETFLIANNYPRIEIKRPVVNSIIAVEGENNASLYLAWNGFALSTVKLEYTLDGGESWQIISKSESVYDGFYATGNSSYRVLVGPGWVGQKVKFKVSSVYLPDVFDVSEEVLVVDKFPFSITPEFFEVPLGTDLAIDYEMSFPGWIQYDLFNSTDGVTLLNAEEYLETGSGVLKIETDDLMVGSYYYVGITGPGWNRTYYVDFRVINATDLREVAEDSPKVMLYPVPVKDLLSINAPGLSNDELVVLYDLTGRRLMEALLGDAPLNLGHLKSGVYLLVIDGQSYKVVKQ